MVTVTAKDFALAEHLELPLDCHDFGHVGLEWFLGGGVCRAKIGNHIREGCRCIVAGRRHAVGVLTCRDRGKRCNLDCILPEWFERGEVNRVVVIITLQDPWFVSLGEESCAIEDTDADVNSVLVGDWITQEPRGSQR